MSEAAAFYPVGLLPVVVFLLVLVYLDSYKLVRLATVLWVIALGGLVAGLGYWVNGTLLPLTGLDFLAYARLVSPGVEECLKGLVMVGLFRAHRIGFLVDAAILGFAVGAGFALVENVYYLYSAPGAHPAVWIVRGFGTALMHGGATALFGVVGHTLTERHMKINPVRYLPGLVLAGALHAVFNHFPGSPILATVGTILLLPPLFRLIFLLSARRLHAWLELDFDADAQLLDQLNSGSFRATKTGRFLSDLRDRFDGPVVADMLCYLRVYTELAMRAKGLLLMRENGFDVPIGARTRDNLRELQYLERSIGKTGCLAMKPFLMMERKDLWQMNVLGR